MSSPDRDQTSADVRERRAPEHRRGPSGPPPCERVIELYGPALLRFCAARVGPDRTEDVFQETMLAALRALDQVRDAASIRSWLFSIAQRKVIDSHRAQARAPQPVAEPEPRSQTDDDVTFVDDAAWEPVRRLPDKQRQAVTLRFLGDLSYREIADVMQTSEAAARRNVFEALKRLRTDPTYSTTTKGQSSMTTATTAAIRDRVDALDWDELREQLNRQGYALTAPLLDAAECEQLADLFDGGRFRATIDMARHRFGEGRYRYFDHPLPDTIAALRTSFYRHLAPIANDWSQLLRGDSPTFPLEHGELLQRCREAGQERPTPLILRYGEGDWNALHQDLYGDVYFPFQVLTILAEPGVDFDGGEFVLMEQRPRAQSRAHVLKPPQGAFVIFPTQQRPNKGKNGYHRVGVRHGMGTVTRGQRTALGVIFHDAA